jgi:hypothetical protein
LYASDWLDKLREDGEDAGPCSIARYRFHIADREAAFFDQIEIDLPGFSDAIEETVATV